MSGLWCRIVAGIQRPCTRIFAGRSNWNTRTPGAAEFGRRVQFSPDGRHSRPSLASSVATRSIRVFDRTIQALLEWVALLGALMAAGGGGVVVSAGVHEVGIGGEHVDGM